MIIFFKIIKNVIKNISVTVFMPIIVYSYGLLFNCMTVDQASDAIMNKAFISGLMLDDCLWLGPPCHGSTRGFL